MTTGRAREFPDGDEWDRRVLAGASQALRLARDLVDDPAARPEDVVLARAAICRALFEQGRLTEARAAATEALDAARLLDRADAALSVELSIAVVLAESGDLDGGLAVLDDLSDRVGADIRPRVLIQRGYLLHHAGRLPDALAALDEAERSVGRHDDVGFRVRLLINRGLVLLQQGRMTEAERDLIGAERAALDAGMVTTAAQCRANLAVLRGRARRLAEAVTDFETAARRFAEGGDPLRPVAILHIDRAEVMMHSGMVHDAVAAARRALELVVPTSNRTLVGDAQLLVARAELAAGACRAAAASAEVAESVFAASGRHDMVAQASSIAAHARLRTVTARSAVATELATSAPLVGALRTQGWHRLADELALERVRVAARFGSLADVVDDVAHLRGAATSDRRDLALAGLLVEALALREDGLPDAALDACRRGLDRLDDIIAEAPTLEQRSGAMRLGADLSQLTIDLAVDLDDAATVLAAADGTRARALHDEMASRERHRPLTEVGSAQLRRELGDRLGDRTLVEWVVSQRRVLAVVFDRQGARLVDVASVSDLVRARDRLLIHLDLAASDPDGSSVRAMRAAGHLDELLIEPLRIGGDAGVVMVPVDLLHGVPWSGLPSLARRPCALAPNAQIWLDADRRAGTPIRSAGLVVGPGVGGAEQERAAISRWCPNAAVASGAGASATTVASMLAGYDLVHVAAHGAFRSDRPLLSTLRLASGESTLHDTVPERVDSRLVVLSSCEGGAQGAADGSEVLGFGAVLLARGAASVLAPLTVVRDLECAEFVAEVHDELASGESVACAAANVRRRWLAVDDLSRWAVASSFTCFGSGASSVAPTG